MRLLSRLLARFGRPAAPEPTRVCDLKDIGLVQIAGVARALDEPLLAPFSGIPSATWSVRVERWTRERSRHGTWILSDELDEGHSFFVDDETGTARVDRRGWSTLVVRPLVIDAWSGYEVYDRPRVEANLARFTARYGRERLDFFDGLGTEVRYLEQAIPVGARVSVVGIARPTAEPVADGRSAGYREAPRLFAVEPGDEKLLIRRLPDGA